MLLYISCEPNLPPYMVECYEKIKHQVDFTKSYIKDFATKSDFWHICEIDHATMCELKAQLQYDAKYERKDASLMAKWQDKAFIEFTAQGAFYSLASLPKLNALHLDYENLAYRQRLMRGGRQKEAVARAVLQGLKDNAPVLDATAGLGRESMILAHAKAQVYCCERQLPMWILLYDSLYRASLSPYFPFQLPTLLPLGSFTTLNLPPIEVIYYDPMFPEKNNSAQVKKDMFIFQQSIGQDEDCLDFLHQALALDVKRVVVKRPKSAQPLCDEHIKVAYAVDGGQCRFDCYTLNRIIS